MFRSDLEVGEWLETQPVEFRKAIAFRMAMRAWPALLRETNIQRQNSVNPELLLCNLNWGLLMLCVSLNQASPLISVLVPYTAERIRTASEELSSISYAIAHAIAAALDDTVAPVGRLSAIMMSLYSAFDDYQVGNELLNDAEFLLKRNSVEELLRTPLWTLDDDFAPVMQPISSFRGLAFEREEEWDFFIRWEHSVLRNEPMPEKLLYSVICDIGADTWQMGIRAVAEEIAKIEALFAVETALADLAKERAEVRATKDRLGIGGNGAPAEFLLEPEVQRASTIIWAAVDDIQEQVEAEQPDKAVIERALGALRSGLVILLKWCGRKADLAVDSVIKWGAPAAVGYAALNPDKVNALVKAVENWLPFLN